MESPDLFGNVYRGRTVLVTGHTGFKGSWLSLWLQRLGARVVGFSLDPPTNPSLFVQAAVGDGMVTVHGDVRDPAALLATIQSYEPSVVFHLAAQSLVLEGYEHPSDTFATNVMGTVNVLEAIRLNSCVHACVVVTTDKCYSPITEPRGLHEMDRLGGVDPYSASKAATELVVEAFRSSFFWPTGEVGLASARAGNVIGGGDWGHSRLIPDCVRSIRAKKPLDVRAPSAIRPWQHVLEPLAGYLWLAALLLDDPERVAQAWNFGPPEDQEMSVLEMVHLFRAAWVAVRAAESLPPVNIVHRTMHETAELRLDTTKAMRELGWAPVLDAQKTIEMVASWYGHWASLDDFDARRETLRQIVEYEIRAAQQGVDWVQRVVGQGVRL